MKLSQWIAVIVASVASAPAFAVTLGFEELPLGASGYYFPGSSQDFKTGPATFNHEYTFGCCWQGWTYTNHTDTTTPGFGNQYSAFPGSGYDGSANYAVAYLGTVPTITFDSPVVVEGAYFAITTYTALSIRDGDGFAKKFGGATGDDPDFLELTITGLHSSGRIVGTKTVPLADYRSLDNVNDYIMWSWLPVGLQSFGPVSKLQFSLESTDNGPFGMNTPAYFAMDDMTITAIPEPATVATFAAGCLVLAAALRRRS